MNIPFYTVVEPNKAHVIVSFGSGRKIYHPAREGSKSAYFFFSPFMQRIMVSLENVKHEINQVELRDINFAPFICDITCWFKIQNPELAAEKLDVDSEGNIMRSIKETLDAQVQGVVRAAAMKQDIVQLMEDRKTFGTSVFDEVNGDLDEWGVQLVKLEIIDFSDTPESNVIQDYEKRREAQISSATRQAVAKREQEALVVEAEARKVSEKARLNSEQAIELRNIEKAELVGMRQQDAHLKVAMQADKANEQKVAADRTLVVGQAEYKADALEVEADGVAKAAIKAADGQAKSVKLEADADAEAKIKKGTAEAQVVEKKGLAEAITIEKKADAQKKFQDASKDVEFKKIDAEVEKVKFQEMGKALAQADVQIVTDNIEFMGFGAKEGAGLGQVLSNVKKGSGTDFVKAITNLIPTKGGAK